MCWNSIASKQIKHFYYWYTYCTVFRSKCMIMKKAPMRLIISILIFASCMDADVNQIKQKLLPSFNVNIPDINLIVPPLPKVLNKEIPVGALKTHINMDSTIKAYTAGTFGANSV